MDFFRVRDGTTKKGQRDIYPEFIVGPSEDLMVRGGSFYAIWDEESGLWSQDEFLVQKIVDRELDQKLGEIEHTDDKVNIRYMKNYSSKSWTTFCSYVNSLPDNSHQLDENLTFSNTEVKKEDYVSRRLSYSLMPGPHDAFDEMLGTLYSETEREKLLWAIGSIVSGDSKRIQKFIVLYGPPGKGKGTVIDIVNWLFKGYVAALDTEALTSRNDVFATDVFRKNPLVGIQHDADLSKIEKNTTFNSIVSHENMNMKEKYKSSYDARANCFIFVGSNNPVKITDGKSGLLRRLIDVTPTGNKIPSARYRQLKNQVQFELGAIADYCLKFYKERGEFYYDDYVPIGMQLRTDPFFNFVDDRRLDFEKQDPITLKLAYTWYKEYVQEGGGNAMHMYKFKEELKNYFKSFDDIVRIDGKQVRSVYSGFLVEKFIKKNVQKKVDEQKTSWIVLDKTKSVLDQILSGCPAQYADFDDKPISKWENVTTKLSDLDTSKVHYVLCSKRELGYYLICVDFDLRDENGEKSKELNLKAAADWPPTYAEFSKGGSGLHLYYIYQGDAEGLARIVDKEVEIKVFTGKSSLRRRVSLCNDLPVREISDGLPLKKKRRTMLNEKFIVNEKNIRDIIQKALNKEIHADTSSNINFIKKILDNAYDSGKHYDVSDLKFKVMKFANKSQHQATRCLKAVGQMKFRSADCENEEVYTHAGVSEAPIVFFDCEVFPNLLLINWKYEDVEGPCFRMINPSPEEVHELATKFRLIGFNCRRYDNHILYARILGKSIEEIYNLSKLIISGSKNAFFGDAYDLSYTDVYDYCSKKQSLKKWEIELGIQHMELGIPWDQPVDESLWRKVAEYCDNDVLATEAVHKANKADWVARNILAYLAGMNVNSTTNQLTGRIIFNGNADPQSSFEYRNMAEDENGNPVSEEQALEDDYIVFDANGRPVFPGYEYANGKSVYRGEEVGEGGYVYAEPGVHRNVALLDIASMHPSSIIAENLFGPYTEKFKALMDVRIAIKHKDFDKVRNMFDGKLAPYLDDEAQAKELSKALKIAINSVYGLTAAKFKNPFKDPRNIDNIVAKRGALFMVNLKNAVQKKGYTVAHIKTDSIKIPNADDYIIQFVMNYGKKYGYTFEHEATYDRMCLVNDAVYIAKYSDDSFNEHPGEWTATGTQFQVPYVFKKLFSGEKIEFRDLCETKTVQTALYLDMNEGMDECKHNYVFVGRAGSFCPIKSGFGGGLLMREKDGKYYAASGTKGYRWLESEMVKTLEKENCIDYSYFDHLVSEAVKAIEQYEDITIFVGSEKEQTVKPEDIPPWEDQLNYLNGIYK